MPDRNNCPACGAAGLRTFYRIGSVPVHSVLLLPTRERAVAYPRGDIHLAFCAQCGFITNTAFEPSRHEYSDRYEATQGFSPTFSAFHRRLAQYLIDRYDLRGKTVLEIGCGDGDFLTLLCEMGGNRGIGFDPAYRPGRVVPEKPLDLTFIPDFYGEKYAHVEADFFVCKMTLEHIQDVAGFIHTVRRSVGERSDALVFFQIPEVTRILKEQAFWDIYYEHCSYFSMGSLARLFRRSGFTVNRVWTDYDDQYLMIEAQPSAGDQVPPLPQEDDLDELKVLIDAFEHDLPLRLRAWRNRLDEYAHQGRRVTLWGGGSKAVAFLTTLGVGQEIEYVVDINPHKAHTFLAGSGQQIVQPEFLREYRPEIVVVMNPIYCSEVRTELDRMDLAPDLLSVNSLEPSHA